MPAQDTAALAQAVNDLEHNQDADGRWRQFVNARLTDEYHQLFDRIDAQIVLLPPSFDCVFHWRLLQEEKLIAALKAEGKPLAKAMSPDDIKHFISHYQRLTEHAIQSMPERCDWLLTMAEDHSITALSRPRTR